MTLVQQTTFENNSQLELWCKKKNEMVENILKREIALFALLYHFPQSFQKVHVAEGPISLKSDQKNFYIRVCEFRSGFNEIAEGPEGVGFRNNHNQCKEEG